MQEAKEAIKAEKHKVESLVLATKAEKEAAQARQDFAKQDEIGESVYI